MLEAENTRLQRDLDDTRRALQAKARVKEEEPRVLPSGNVRRPAVYAAQGRSALTDATFRTTMNSNERWMNQCSSVRQSKPNMLVSSLIFVPMYLLHWLGFSCGKARVVEELRNKLARGKEKRAVLRAALSGTQGRFRWLMVNTSTHIDSRGRCQGTSSLRRARCFRPFRFAWLQGGPRACVGENRKGQSDVTDVMQPAKKADACLYAIEGTQRTAVGSYRHHWAQED